MLARLVLLICLILKQKLTDLLVICVALGYCYGSYVVYQQETKAYKKQLESHDLCHDTPTQLAWVAYKNGEVRCFLEYREYPHKIKAGNLD